MASHRPEHQNGAVETTFRDLEGKGWTIEHSGSEFTLHYPGGGTAGVVTADPRGGLARQQLLNIIRSK